MPDNNANLDSKYLTYDYIVSQFKLMFEKSLYIKSFLCGPMEEIDISKLGLDKYQVLYIEPTAMNVNNFVQEFVFDVAVLDIIQIDKEINNPDNQTINLQDLRNRKYNDTNKAMRDIIASFVQNLYSESWINSEVDLQLPINLSPISAQYDNSLIGWAGSFTITANNKNDLCKSLISRNPSGLIPS